MKEKHVTARYDKAFTWKARTAVLLLILTALLLALTLFWAFEPANKLSYQKEVAKFDRTVNPEGEFGLPVVQADEVLRFQFEFCNDDVHTTTLRWMDYYGPIFDQESIDNEPVISYAIPGLEFEPSDSYCGPAGEPFKLPYYPRDGMFTFRFETCYRVNPIRLHCETLSTEPFILEGVGV